MVRERQRNPALNAKPLSTIITEKYFRKWNCKQSQHICIWFPFISEHKCVMIILFYSRMMPNLRFSQCVTRRCRVRWRHFDLPRSHRRVLQYRIYYFIVYNFYSYVIWYIFYWECDCGNFTPQHLISMHGKRKIFELDASVIVAVKFCAMQCHWNKFNLLRKNLLSWCGKLILILYR